MLTVQHEFRMRMTPDSSFLEESGPRTNRCLDAGCVNHEVEEGELTLPDGETLQPRFRHSITAVTLAPGLIEVIMFGGCPGGPETIKNDNDLPKLAETTILRFESRECPSTNDGPSTREWVLVDVANNSQRGTTERLREKHLLIATKVKEEVQ